MIWWRISDRLTRAAIGLGACLAAALAACEPSTTPHTSEVANAPSVQDAEAALPDLKSKKMFYCDATLNGQHYLYVNPNDVGEAIVGFDFSPAYRDAYPNEAMPQSSMTIVVSEPGSGMRYANDKMKFHAKGESGMLTLSDGQTVQCDLQNATSEGDRRVPSSGGISFEWSANGFETLPEEFKWQGGGGDYPGVTLAIPETDNFVWISECDSGNVKTYFLLAPMSLEMGDQTTLQFETDKTPLRTYPIEMGPLPFGNGDMSPILILSPDDPMFTDLTTGEWAYFQVGEGEEAVKLRVSTWGAISAWNTFIPACWTLGEEK